MTSATASRNPFHPRLSDLPEVLPIFPLPGAIVLPWAQLPLNIFEPRYLNMTLDALGAGRLIGMVQPHSGAGPEAIYAVGCAGRITAFSETDDGRLLIVLTGVCRFRAAQDVSPIRGYRRIRPEWQPFAADLEPPEEAAIGREEVLRAARRYVAAQRLTVDLESLAALPPEALVNALAMHLPFAPPEKQALLEAPSPSHRARALVALAELAREGVDGPDGTMH